jgi:hypothetical protein
MQGIIFQQLQHFVTRNYGHDTWASVLSEAGHAGKMFLPTAVYPDQDAIVIVQAACKLLNADINSVLEAFGEFIAPNLIKIYSTSIKQEWKVLDLLEHTEKTMHRAVRFSDKNASPPALQCTRIAANKVRIEYLSERKMAALGIGIIKGFGKIYNEPLTVKAVNMPDRVVLEITRLN